MDPGLPRPVQVRDDRGWHDGWVKAARRDEATGRWRGFVDFIDRSDARMGGHYIQWADQSRIRPRPETVL